MLRDYKSFSLWFFLILAACSMATADESQAVSRWIMQLGHNIAGQRVRAAAQLAEFGSGASSAIDPLIACLDDSNADVRLYVAFALGRITQEPAKTIAALIPTLSDDDEHVQYSAAWSISRIAQQLDASNIQSIGDVETLLDVFRQAHSEITQANHHRRHRSAVDSAIAALNAQLAKLNPPEISTQNHAVAEQSEQENRNLAIEQIVAEFREIGLVSRLRMIERLAQKDLNGAPQAEKDVQFELQSRVLTEALMLGNFHAVHYATLRWPEAAQQILHASLSAQSDDSQLPEWMATTVDVLIPRTPECTARLLRIVQSTQCSAYMRCAAMGALSRQRVGTPAEVAMLLQLVSHRDEDESVRLAAVECLGACGVAAVESVDALLMILRDADASTTMRSAAAANIGRIAPNHSAAIEVICAALSQLDVNDYFFGDLVESIGMFGPKAVMAVKFCSAGLGSHDEYARQRCAETIERLGPTATAAIPELVARIADPDETVGVKMAVARAIKALGPAAIEAVSQHLSQPQAQVREDVLRTLAIAGADARMTMPECIARLADENESPRVRAAAATALGSMQEFAAVAAPGLRRIIESAEQPELRGAALIALAQVSSTSRADVAPYAADSSLRIRASAAFALHLCGETSKSLELLVGMLDGSEESKIIEAAIKDVGPIAIPTLLQTVRNPQVQDEQRLGCFRVVIQLERSDWSPLLELLGDERLGEDFYDCLLELWDADVDLLPDLVACLEDPRLTSDAHDRVERLIDYLTSDLGAGGDEPTWNDGFALTQPWQESSEVGSEMMAIAPAAKARARGADTFAVEFAPEEGPMPSVAPSEADDTRIVANYVATDNPRLVRVFYGTNRVPVEPLGNLMAIARPIVAALGIALATFIFCVVMFVRLSAWRYAFATFTGLVAVGFCVASARFPPSLGFMHAGKTIEYSGGLRDETDLGFCEVSIPESHQPGELEAPTLFRLEVEPDPAKHIILQNVERLSHDQFYRMLHADLDHKGKNLLVFVHGYNVSFEDAARRTAQMAFDLKFPGAPVFFSWPSQANWYRYGKDKENIELSVSQIQSFLQEIAAKSNADTINLVAHSMGTVGLTAALQEIQQSGDQTLFNQVVLAAPDIDANTFKQSIAPRIVTKARRVTLYTSQTDLALIASRYFNQGARAGDSGAEVLVFPGIDTIDASAVDTSLLGHSYYGSNVSVLHDLGLLLQGQPIESRQYLRSMPAGNQPYWLFDPSKVVQQASAAAVAPMR